MEWEQLIKLVGVALGSPIVVALSRRLLMRRGQARKQTILQREYDALKSYCDQIVEERNYYFEKAVRNQAKLDALRSAIRRQKEE